MHLNTDKTTREFIESFNNDEKLKIRAFILYGSDYRDKDVYLESFINEPEIFSWMNDLTYNEIHLAIQGKATPVKGII